MKVIAADMNPLKKRKIFFGILTFFMFAGIAAGTIFVISDPDKCYVTKPIFSQNLIKKSGMSFVGLFSNSFFSIELILIFQMLCGFFAVGQPLCVFTLFHRGAAGGISAALIYETYGIKGVLIILIMLLPTLVVNMYILVLGARESIKFSNILGNYAFGSRNEAKADIKLYSIKFIVLTFFALICSAADSLLTYFFSGMLL